MKNKGTIEEAAERMYPINSTGGVMEMLNKHQLNNSYKQEGFIAGVKFQAKRMYSEEDLRKAFNQGQENVDYNDTYGWSSKLTEQEWFLQFKKQNNEQ